MNKAMLEGSKTSATILQPSDRLRSLLAQLTAAQADAVRRLVEGEAAGKTLESMLRGPEKVCNWSTYYRRPSGWRHKREFQEALRLAREEMRSTQLSVSLSAAVEELNLAAPLAARDLRRQIAGDEVSISALIGVALDRKRKEEERLSAVRSLGQIGTEAVVQTLVALANDKKATIRQAAIDALGLAGHGADPQRRQADVTVLDRAAPETASKGAGIAVTVDDVARARAEVGAWERERFSGK